MPYRFRVRRLATMEGVYTTRPDLGPPLTESEVIDEIIHASNVSAGDVVSVLTQLRRVLVRAAQLTRPSEPLFGLFRMGLSSGGRLSDPAQFVGIDDIAPWVNFYPANEFQQQFRAGLVIERTGMDADRTPEIASVRDDATGSDQSYTPGDVLHITGDDLRLDPADASQGVFFVDMEGNETRATRYVLVTTGQVLVLVPAGLRGPQGLVVRVKYGPNLRQTTHGAMLLPSASKQAPHPPLTPSPSAPRPSSAKAGTAATAA